MYNIWYVSFRVLCDNPGGMLAVFPCIQHKFCDMQKRTLWTLPWVLHKWEVGHIDIPSYPFFYVLLFSPSYMFFYFSNILVVVFLWQLFSFIISNSVMVWTASARYNLVLFAFLSILYCIVLFSPYQNVSLPTARTLRSISRFRVLKGHHSPPANHVQTYPDTQLMETNAAFALTGSRLPRKKWTLLNRALVGWHLLMCYSYRSLHLRPSLTIEPLIICSPLRTLSIFTIILFYKAFDAILTLCCDIRRI